MGTQLLPTSFSVLQVWHPARLMENLLGPFFGLVSHHGLSHRAWQLSHIITPWALTKMKAPGYGELSLATCLLLSQHASGHWRLTCSFPAFLCLLYLIINYPAMRTTPRAVLGTKQAVKYQSVRWAAEVRLKGLALAQLGESGGNPSLLVSHPFSRWMQMTNYYSLQPFLVIHWVFMGIACKVTFQTPIFLGSVVAPWAGSRVLLLCLYPA